MASSHGLKSDVWAPFDFYGDGIVEGKWGRTKVIRTLERSLQIPRLG